MDQNVIQIIGKYSLLEKLGEGLHGVTYRAWNDQQQKAVVAKLLRPEISSRLSFRGPTLNAINESSAIQSPFLACFSEVERTDDSYLLVREYVEGRTLIETIQDGLFDNRRLLWLTRQLACGLKDIHGAGLIHGNLKLSNIIISEADDLRLVDCCLTAEFDMNQIDDDIPAETFLKSMAPEIMNGQAASRWSDLFAMGTILFEAACGDSVFKTGSNRQLINSIVHNSPDFRKLHERELSGDVILMIEKLVSANEQERFQNVGGLLITLTEMERHSSDLEEQISDPEKRHSPQYYAALIFLTLIAIVVWSVAASYLK